LGIRQADVGNLLSSGDTTPLVVITQTLPISVVFTLPEAELPAVTEQLRAEQKLVVEAWDRSESNKLAEGELESLDNLIDTATGTIKLKARFENAEQSLFPNQFVNIRLRVKTLENAVLMPASAIQFGGTGTFTYVVDAEDKVQLTPVKVSAGNGQVSVVEMGPKPGDRVVLEGTDSLRSGNKVTVVTDAAPVAEQKTDQPGDAAKAERGPRP
jgi:multidrug efflux system membrane fusion protein